MISTALEAWLGPEGSTAMWLSLRVALWATVASLIPAVLVALALARGRFWGRQWLNGVVHLPLILPPVVTGYLLLLTFGRRGWVGSWLYEVFGVTLAFRWSGAALAAAIMAFPLLVRAIRLSIEAVDPRLEEAAATLGAPRIMVFLTVTLPLILPGILAGAILAFAKALGEFGATITFVGAITGETQTLPSAIHAFLQVPGGEGPAARLVIVAVALAMAALLISEWASRRVAMRIGGRDRTGHNQSGQDREGPEREGPEREGHGREGHGRARPDRANQDRASQDRDSQAQEQR